MEVGVYYWNGKCGGVSAGSANVLAWVAYRLTQPLVICRIFIGTTDNRGICGFVTNNVQRIVVRIAWESGSNSSSFSKFRSR
jgi:hypothetical protein